MGYSGWIYETEPSCNLYLDALCLDMNEIKSYRVNFKDNGMSNTNTLPEYMNVRNRLILRYRGGCLNQSLPIA